MSNWRDNILKEFVPNVSRLTLVADPDSLLTEEKLALELCHRGFEQIDYNDPVEFRYAYELKYRSSWDRGEHIDLVVIHQFQDSPLESLPYDLLKAGRKLSFSLGRLFPKLSYPVVEKLERSLLDALFSAQIKFAPERMGDNATKDFILHHVFGIAAELIVSEVDLLRALLRLHYNKISIPQLLMNYFVQVLKEHSGFQAWPLDEIVPDEKAFFAFLQERWPVFLNRLGTMEHVYEDTNGYNLRYPGPEVLPFAHHDVRVYIDNLFVEGKLMPVRKTDILVDMEPWISSGITESGKDDEDTRIPRLFEHFESGLPAVESRYSDWTAFALKWAELASLVYGNSRGEEKTHFLRISKILNENFSQWLNAHYASLINLPPMNPAMLHHVPRRLARELEETTNGRVALIVVDGLALDQWITIRQILQAQDRSLVMRESGIFAWIPTLTSVSRQAIFSGKAPFYFPSSINTTNSEGNLWKQFWEASGLSRLDVAYQRGLGDGDVISVLETTLHPGKTRAVGLVIDKVDKIMHGMQLGAAGMHNQIKQWCYNGFLGSLIGYLLDYGYQVWLTSDHGNIECRGMGRPSEGVIAETRGERVRVYPNPELRDLVANRFSGARVWHPIGLPSNYYPLIAENSNAFIAQDETIVGHGGIAIEEVIVPLVKFERRTR